jgi:hypothetical protein
MGGEARTEAARVPVVVFSLSPAASGSAPLAGSMGRALARRTVLGRHGIIKGA